MSQEREFGLPAIAFVDGGSRGNPGPSASAFSLSLGCGHVVSRATYLGHGTNNEAEYKALLGLCEYVVSDRPLPYGSELLVLSDSKLVVNQMTSRWRVNDPRMQLLKDSILNCLSSGANSLTVRLVHIGRAHNGEADRAVNACLDAAKTRDVEVGQNLEWFSPLTCSPDAWVSSYIPSLKYKTAGLLDVLTPARGGFLGGRF